MSNSTVFTIGSALRQAENDGFPVGLMVEGQWFAGAIGGLDGDGVLLEAEDGPVTIRLTAISVVRAIRDAGVAARLTAPASPPATIAPVLSLARSEDTTTADNAEEPLAEEPLAEEPLADEPAEKLPSVAEQLAAHVDAPTDVPIDEVDDEVGDEPVDHEPVDDGPAYDGTEDEPVDEAMAQLALIEEEMALLDHLPEDVTDDERYALAKRRALMAQQAAAAFADPAAIVAGLTGKVIEPAESMIEVSPIEVGRIDLAPVTESPVTESPVNESPVTESPVDQETEADETTDEGAPLDETPIGEPSGEEAPATEPTPLASLSPAEPLRLDVPAEPTGDELELHPVDQIALVEAAVAAEHAANPLVSSSTQTDDWRAMLVSLRQQAAETPQTTEPEKRRSWRLAR